MKLALPFLLLVLGMVIAEAPPAENEPIAMEDRSPETIELLSQPTTNDNDDRLAKTIEERNARGVRICNTDMDEMCRYCELLCKASLDQGCKSTIKKEPDLLRRLMKKWTEKSYLKVCPLECPKVYDCNQKWKCKRDCLPKVLSCDASCNKMGWYGLGRRCPRSCLEKQFKTKVTHKKLHIPDGKTHVLLDTINDEWQDIGFA